jgi:hypothetical protein
MKLKDGCNECVESKPPKEYKEIPASLCPCVDSKPKPEPPKPTIIKMTDYCLREYIQNMATSKFCNIPPRGCS